MTSLPCQANALCEANHTLFSQVYCDRCKEQIKTLQLNLAW